MAIVQVQVAVPDREVGERIADALVHRRLVAASQLIGPMRSSYVWRGEFTVAEEWLLLALVSERSVDAVREEIVRLHPYELPEMVTLPVSGGAPGFLAWVERSGDEPSAEEPPA